MQVGDTDGSEDDWEDENEVKEGSQQNCHGDGKRAEYSAVIDEQCPVINRKRLSRVQMDSLVMNYFVVQGYREAAQQLEKESKVAPQVELQTLEDRTCIRSLIMSGEIGKAITSINKLSSDLLTGNVKLRFGLQKQQLVELVVCGKVEEALAFAQTDLAYVAEEYVSQLILIARRSC
jgi:hypothetical protein